MVDMEYINKKLGFDFVEFYKQTLIEEHSKEYTEYDPPYKPSPLAILNDKETDFIWNFCVENRERLIKELNL